MALTINTRTYNQDRVLPDSVSYTGPANTITSIDKMVLSRAYPKASGTFKGVAKPLAKMTKTVVVNPTTGETRDMIAYIGGSIPVGTPPADVDGVLADLASWVNTTPSKDLFKSLDITQ